MLAAALTTALDGFPCLTFSIPRPHTKVEGKLYAQHGEQLDRLVSRQFTLLQLVAYPTYVCKHKKKRKGSLPPLLFSQVIHTESMVRDSCS